MSASEAFDPAPSLDRTVAIDVSDATPAGMDVIGFLVGPDGDVPSALGVDRDRLVELGFTGKVGSVITVSAASAPVVIVAGVGESPDSSAIRDGAASISRAAGKLGNLAIQVPPSDLQAVVSGEAIVEGALLARYSYDALRDEPTRSPVTAVTLVVGDGGPVADVAAGAERGRILARATALSRDLANTPHSHLTATKFADLAERIGPDHGLEVEVFDKEQLIEMRMAGLLAINAGSTEPPRMIKLTYRPEGTPSARLAVVGKGIMYDSGGLSLKPSDHWHAQMKNDMSGASATLAAMCALRELGATAEVVGYLVCTDNMPSGTATALGDVMTMRNGMTVEMIDTDAEGRVAMSDALVLAAESEPDAILDIATLTGSVARALGNEIAGVMGNDQAVVDQVKTAAEISGELVWQFPLHKPYRRMLDSPTADIMNCAAIGLPDALLSTLFLSEFVGDTPWAHIDIAGTSQADAERSIQVPGCSGFGARLLAHTICSFESTK